MSVSGISSNNFSQYNSQNAQGVGQQIQQDFQQLGADLQSGNLSAAQSDYATLQQALPQNNANSQTQTTQNANPIQQAFAQLSQALQSGNLSAAQQDFATIQQDAQNQPTATHRHHHGHHGGSSAGSANSATSSTSSASSNTSGDSTNSSVSSLFSELGSALQSGNLTTAQQAYTSLVQDFQQYAQQAGAFSSQTGSTGVSVTA
jgi:outer membrane protein assembly factor BamD (BamD/ComL family)